MITYLPVCVAFIPTPPLNKAYLWWLCDCRFKLVNKVYDLCRVHFLRLPAGTRLRLAWTQAACMVGI